MTIDQARALLQRYRTGLCTDEERLAVERWLDSMEDDGSDAWMDDKEVFAKMLRENIANEMDSPLDVSVLSLMRFRFLRIAVAIILMATAGTMYYFFYDRTPEDKKAGQVARVVVSPEIVPGTTGAILELADGRKIVLDSAGTGTVATQGAINIVNRDGALVYDGQTSGKDEIVYNTVSTPRGRQFTLQLQDGTKVWLNAASSIRYPATFSDTARTVEISGEAYFEVTTLRNPDGKSKIPFRVKILTTNNDEAGVIEVTGTQFNVNAYKEEALIKTTLVEGGIVFKKAGMHKVLLAGQQAQVGVEGTICVLAQVNVAAEIAWKNGFFTYDKTDIRTVMRQIARWYDIEVDYKNGNIPDGKYWGDIQRDASLPTVLKVLEISGVKFSIEGRKVIVSGG